MMKRHQYRDVQMIPNGDGAYLAVTCDVAAFIGSKPMDLVQVTPQMAGYHATAVPLMELLALNAKIISMTDTIGVEMDPTGKEIIAGVKAAMTDAGVEEDCLTGSTEDNIATLATSIGITVIGCVEAAFLDKSKPMAGQLVYCVGLPKMGQRFVEEELVGHRGEVCTLAITKVVRETDGVGHMLPVGSKGIQYELATLLALEQLAMEAVPCEDLDIKASAGPSTCVLMTCSEAGASALKERIKVPMTLMGTLVEA